MKFGPYVTRQEANNRSAAAEEWPPRPEGKPPLELVVLNPHTADLTPATLVEVRAKDLGQPGFPMHVAARVDNLCIGTASGWTVAQALRNLADVLEMKDPRDGAS